MFTNTAVTWHLEISNPFPPNVFLDTLENNRNPLQQKQPCASANGASAFSFLIFSGWSKENIGKRWVKRKSLILRKKNLPVRMIAIIWYYFFQATRSSRSQMFFKIDVVKNFANFAEEYQLWSLFLIKIQA